MIRACHRFGVLVACVVLTGLLPLSAAAQGAPLPNLGLPAFVRLWARTDYPVADGKAQRTYYFGPAGILSCQELYKEGPDGRRPVTYLDKARLEMTNPASGAVTSGLLAKELISGKMQFGDSTFQSFAPAQVPVAGDPGDTPAPTYASFAKVASVEAGQNRAERRTGRVVTDTLTKAGATATDDSLARYNVTLADYRDELGHNIPNVFVDFFGLRGTVATLDGSTVSYGDDLLIDWLPVMGLPIAEPYWAVVPVAGASTWVLMQPFERRVITYTPENDAAFRVELGNIGQHYKTWRHPDGSCNTRSEPSGPTGDPVPDGQSATINKKIGFWGTVFRATFTGFTPNEALSFWFTAPTGEVAGTRRPLNARHNGTLQNFPISTDQSFSAGLWAFTMQGDTSSHEAIVYFRIVDRPGLPARVEAVPDGKNGVATPKFGWPGTIFRITVTGFTPNEPLSFWLTSPDGSVSGTPRPINAQHPGRIQGFPIYSDEEMQAGVWAVTFQGDKSGAQSIAYFRIVGG